jgi:hypothetical protein
MKGLPSGLDAALDACMEAALVSDDWDDVLAPLASALNLLDVH